MLHCDLVKRVQLHQIGRMAEQQTSPVPASARRHKRLRSQHATEIAEDYVEAISEIIEAKGEARVVDLSKHFGVSHVTVIRTVERLQEQDLVSTAPYRAIALTETGESMARKSRDRHQLVLDFLLSLGLSRDTAETDAEGIEHHVSAETLEAMRRFVDGSPP